MSADKTPKNHLHDTDGWMHSHAFDDESHVGTMQKRTLIVALLTALMMVAEILGGWYYGSMAVLADGWHMGTHTIALGLAFFSYWYANRNRHTHRFTFGTGKVNTLGAFTSALFLAMVGFFMIAESIGRLFTMVPIRYSEALTVAIIGLVVNIVSAVIMAQGTGHKHHHDHAHGHHHHDQNFRAAYIHILSDAVTSVLAIIALVCALLFGWNFLDPVMGIAGALLILFWAWGLIKTTSRILLDAAVTDSTVEEIRGVLETIPGTSVTDLHVWYIANRKKAAIVSIVADNPESPSYYKDHLKGVSSLEHVSVEVNKCLH